MKRFIIMACTLLAGCVAQRPITPIELLTRSGCVQTDVMRVRTEAAIKALAFSTSYSVVDLDTLPADDVRRGYPTPTVLIDGVDLFGMPKPAPPFPDPT